MYEGGGYLPYFVMGTNFEEYICNLCFKIVIGNLFSKKASPAHKKVKNMKKYYSYTKINDRESFATSLL